MSAEPWKKWTPDFLREASIDARNHGFPPWAEMLDAFADLLEAEQRGERCVLPMEVASEEMDTLKRSNGKWSAWRTGSFHPEGQGNTQEAAILDLTRKLGGE